MTGLKKKELAKKKKNIWKYCRPNSRAFYFRGRVQCNGVIQLHDAIKITNRLISLSVISGCMIKLFHRVFKFYNLENFSHSKKLLWHPTKDHLQKKVSGDPFVTREHQNHLRNIPHHSCVTEHIIGRRINILDFSIVFFIRIFFRKLWRRTWF